MHRKIKIEFDEMNVQESVTYILATEFGLKPNVLKAEINGDSSGIMILILEGEKSAIEAAISRLKNTGYEVSDLEKHITRNKDRCFSCGACMSLCPTKSFTFDPVTWEVHLDIDTCIACGSCINSCPVKALRLNI
ncbi:MAG: 4Fe-4S binding protein [Candidatus Methanomethylophilaceae archaeon]|nr:4Fe-4S binding protein [Candidatus Methanomethylophilaceae archaeon]